MIRHAHPEDIPALARLYVDSWRAAFSEIVPQAYLKSLTYAQKERRWLEFLETDGGAMLVIPGADDTLQGLSAFGACRDADLPGYGEVYSFYIIQDEWSRGLGRSLMEHSMGALEPVEPAGCALWTFGLNRRARGFYEHLGFMHDGSSRSVTLAGERVEEVRYVKQY